MTETKTLNQHLQNQFPEWSIDCISMRKIKKGFQEWLEQKLKEQKYPKFLEQAIYAFIINELLEEVKNCRVRKA